MTDMDKMMIEIEPLTNEEAESAFLTLIGILDRFGCVPGGTVSAKSDEGVSFSLHFNADRARKLITAYNPDDRLREALVALADAADKCSEAPHFIVQPFLRVYREHGETIADARSALFPLPQGDT